MLKKSIMAIITTFLFLTATAQTLCAGEKVHLYMWGGDGAVNRYMDQWISPRLKKQHEIELKITPLTDVRDLLNRLLTEKSLGKTRGSVDLIWINGENFAIAKKEGLLQGPFMHKLNSYTKYYSPSASATDFGVATDGMEAPWGTSQFVMIYDSEKVTNPPRNMSELEIWMKKNPGRFTYPAPPDFTGSAFVRQVLIDRCGGYDGYLKAVEDGTLSEVQVKTWAYLNRIRPWAWREGDTWPESSGMMDRLYSNGEIWITMSYNPVHAFSRVKDGSFPSTSKSYLLDGGTFTNTHFWAIPFNAPHAESALRTIDLLLSPEAQIEKFKPTVWGDGLALDVTKLDTSQQKQLGAVDRGNSIPPEELSRHALPEVSGPYIDQLEREWMEHVGKK